MTRTLRVKEMFLTIQGEGAHAGRVAVFVRFSGCNLWNGAEGDRERATCRFCDTDFVGTDGPDGGLYDPLGLVAWCNGLWPANEPDRMVVLTGGEPLTQVTRQLVDRFHLYGWYVACETNGTRPTEGLDLDWVCVSPKARASCVPQPRLDELKLVWPQDDLDPARYLLLPARRFSLQPCDGVPDAVDRCIAYVLEHPTWRLSLQTHKMIGIR